MAINVTASAATVTSVTYTTSRLAHEVDHNDTATITLHFTGVVTVTGTPFLTFNNAETANYTSGSGTNALVFTYVVPDNGHKTTALAITAVTGTINNADITGADITLSPHLGVNEPAVPAGVAGDPINLALSDPSEGQAAGPITLTISDIPSDWTLYAGVKNADGSWTVTTSDPSSLTVTTPSTFTGAAVLQVNETWTNADGSIGYATVADNVEAYAPGNPIFALSGDDHLTGGGGNDLFVFSQPIGNDTIDSFNVASDQIDLIGFGTSRASATFKPI